MPNMRWSQLNKNQLGQYGEYYAKMEFTSYGYDVYTSEIDDHGVDFGGINYSAKNISLLERYKAENFFRYNIEKD